MTSPADDCGVTGGCQACPLFAADVCGDPWPGWDKPNGDPAPAPRTGLLCGSCDAGLPMSCTCPRFVADGEGVVTDLAAPPVPDWAVLVDAYLKAALAELADPDAPDVDPAEPKPEGAGCCGGKCAA